VALGCLILAGATSILHQRVKGNWPHTTDFFQLLLAFIGLYTAVIIGSALFLKQLEPV